MAALSDDDTRQRYGLAPEAAVRRQRLGADGVVRLDSDSFTVAQVASALESSVWDRPVVVAGGTVWLTVQGSFVGEGAPVEITLKDARNRTVGRGRAPMHRDRAIVEVSVDRQAAERDRDGVLAAADIEIRDLGLKSVSAPILVLPFAELVDAAWDAPEARDGDDVGLTCRVTGSHAGVERLEGRTAEVEILRGDEGDDAVFEPVVTLRAPVASGKVSVRWRVGFDAEGKAQIATQPEYDAAAERTGAKAERYARPAYHFRVAVGGLGADSPALGYRDHVDLAWDAGTERPAAGAPVTVHLADGTTQELTLGDDGRQRLTDVPPGPVEALFGPDPRVWIPPPDLASGPRGVMAPPDPLPNPRGIVVPPKEPVLLAAAHMDALLLADVLGLGPDDDDDSFVEWLWGTMAGDFNENATYDQIVANIGASFVPVVGQIMDVRDVFAGLYLLWKDQGYRDWLKWLALFVTLVGIIPVLGDALKGVFRIALRSIRRGADDVAGAAAQALEAAFRKAKDALEEADIDLLDGVDSAAQWVRDLDLSWIVSWSRDAIEWVAGRVVYVFRWAAESAESGILQIGEVWKEGMSRVGLLAGQAFDVLRRRTPRAATPSPTLGTRLRSVVSAVETIQRQANETVERGLNQLYDKLREIAGVPPRPRGTGVSGGVVTPSPLARPARGVPPSYDHDMMRPGPLTSKPGNPAANFAGGKYNVTTLTNDLVLYRAGASGGGRNSLGQWWSRTPPTSAAQQRIDAAIRPQWIDPRTGVLTGSSPLESVYEVRIPAGTTIYEGPVASQGGIYAGGQDVMQVYVEAPWTIPGVTVLRETHLP